MSYLRCFCLFASGDFRHVLCCCFSFVLCALCCQFLWIAHFFIAPSILSNVYFLDRMSDNVLFVLKMPNYLVYLYVPILIKMLLTVALEAFEGCQPLLLKNIIRKLEYNSTSMRNLLVSKGIKAYISNLVHTTCFWNNLHGVRPMSKDCKAKCQC